MKPLKTPFGIPDPKEEKQHKQKVASSPFDFPEVESQQQQPWDDGLSGTINMKNDEGDELIEHQPEEVVEEELPLLEELDITSPLLIRKRIFDVALFRKADDDYLLDPDLSGPLLLGLSLGICLMLSGKIHFNYLYGFGCCGWISIYFLMNFMNQNKLIEFYKVLSYLGYGLTPVVLISILNIFISFQTSVGYIISVLAALWSTLAVAKTFDVILALSHRRLLISYPLFLFYCTFILITIF